MKESELKEFYMKVEDVCSNHQDYQMTEEEQQFNEDYYTEHGEDALALSPDKYLMLFNIYKDMKRD